MHRSHYDLIALLAGHMRDALTVCVGCEQRVPLWDEMEQCFASPEIAALAIEGSGRLTPFQQRMRDMQEESAIELSNQSKERALVGEVI